MKLRTYINCVLLSVVVISTACSNADKSSLISQAEIVSRIADKTAPIILDVRSAEEYKSGHIPGAINAPFNSYKAALAELKLDKDDELVVYCESGKRAKKFGEILKQQGYFEVRHLTGDMLAWRKAHLPVE